MGSITYYRTSHWEFLITSMCTCLSLTSRHIITQELVTGKLEINKGCISLELMSSKDIFFPCTHYILWCLYYSGCINWHHSVLVKTLTSPAPDETCSSNIIWVKKKKENCEVIFFNLVLRSPHLHKKFYYCIDYKQ